MPKATPPPDGDAFIRKLAAHTRRPKPFDAAKLAKRAAPSAAAKALLGDDATGFEVDPDVAYPVVLAELDRLANLGPPVYDEDEREWVGETPPASLATYVQQARGVPGGVVEASKGGPFREQALELARLALTAGLHDAAGGKIGVRILRSPAWRI